MDYKINGKKIPKIAVGTWSWGSGMNGSRIVFGSKSDPKALKESFEAAYENGFSLFDTAAVYGMGNAEKLLALFSEGRDIILSDKFSPSGSFSEKKLEQMYRGSVEKFGGRIPDIYWLHTPKNIEESLKCLCDMKKAGKIGSIGVSNFNLEQLELADRIVNENGCNISGVQNHFSLLFRTSEENGVLEWCRKNDVPFFAYMVLEQGALTGRFNSKNPMPKFSRRGIAFNRKILGKIEPLLELLEKTGKKHGLSVSETAAAYAVAKGTVPIIGVTKVYQAESLPRIAAALLSAEEVSALESCAGSTGIKIKGSWE